LSAAGHTVLSVEVRGSGDAAKRALVKRIPTHPHAHPPRAGANGFWVVQVKPGPPLGWVIGRSSGREQRYHCYAWCRDPEGRRPWLREHPTLKSAVAWMLQHEPEIRHLIARCAPEPDA
jgi:hypothetical protein